MYLCEKTPLEGEWNGYKTSSECTNLRSNVGTTDRWLDGSSAQVDDPGSHGNDPASSKEARQQAKDPPHESKPQQRVPLKGECVGIASSIERSKAVATEMPDGHGHSRQAKDPPGKSTASRDGQIDKINTTTVLSTMEMAGNEQDGQRSLKDGPGCADKDA
jgi:hypothetical protein